MIKLFIVKGLPQEDEKINKEWLESLFNTKYKYDEDSNLYVKILKYKKGKFVFKINNVIGKNKGHQKDENEEKKICNGIKNFLEKNISSSSKKKINIIVNTIEKIKQEKKSHTKNNNNSKEEEKKNNFVHNRTTDNDNNTEENITNEKETYIYIEPNDDENKHEIQKTIFRIVKNNESKLNKFYDNNDSDDNICHTKENDNNMDDKKTKSLSFLNEKNSNDLNYNKEHEMISSCCAIYILSYGLMSHALKISNQLLLRHKIHSFIQIVRSFRDVYQCIDEINNKHKLQFDISYIVQITFQKRNNNIRNDNDSFLDDKGNNMNQEKKEVSISVRRFDNHRYVFINDPQDVVEFIAKKKTIPSSSSSQEQYQNKRKFVDKEYNHNFFPEMNNKKMKFNTNKFLYERKHFS